MLRSEVQRQAIRDWSVALLVLVGATTALAQSHRSPATSGNEEPLVRTNRAQLTLAGAERAIVASRKQAEEMGIRVNIAVVDDGGHVLAFARMDGARPASVYTSITKAMSAATNLH